MCWHATSCKFGEVAQVVGLTLHFPHTRPLMINHLLHDYRMRHSKCAVCSTWNSLVPYVTYGLWYFRIGKHAISPSSVQLPKCTCNNFFVLWPYCLLLVLILFTYLFVHLFIVRVYALFRYIFTCLQLVKIWLHSRALFSIVKYSILTILPEWSRLTPGLNKCATNHTVFNWRYYRCMHACSKSNGMLMTLWMTS